LPYQSVFRPDLFEGQTIIVTGGGSGIGRCTAHELAALGANVAIVGRTVEKLTEVQQEIEEDGGQAMSLACDIRDETMVVGAIDAVLARYGRIDGLVNNAGGQFRSPLKAISTRGFEAVVRNNLTGGFIFMREVYNRWMEANGGAIVNIIADIWHGWPDDRRQSGDGRNQVSAACLRRRHPARRDQGGGDAREQVAPDPGHCDFRASKLQSAR
jgi:citronellol/citronellal dehydrogenase